MTNAVTLGDLKYRARRLSNTVNDPNVDDDELTASANHHVPKLWNRLVDAGPPDYAASTTPITTSSGIIPYALPDDFLALTEVYVREDTAGSVRRLLPMPEGARQNYKAPAAEYTVDLEYLPIAPELNDDSDEVDGISGWADLIANLMALDVMTKRESDPSVVINNISRIEAEITTRSRKRDRGPKRITDLDDLAYTLPNGWGRVSRLECYRLRAGNIELYESAWTFPP